MTLLSHVLIAVALCPKWYVRDGLGWGVGRVEDGGAIISVGIEK